jgi:hypothetical protein
MEKKRQTHACKEALCVVPTPRKYRRSQEPGEEPLSLNSVTDIVYQKSPISGFALNRYGCGQASAVFSCGCLLVTNERV